MSIADLEGIYRRLDNLETALRRAGISADDPRPNKAETWLSRRQQADRWGVHWRTVVRRGHDPELGLPPEFQINGYWYRSLSQIEDWERQQMSKRMTGTKSAPAKQMDHNA
jgi:hypothetical protein